MRTFIVALIALSLGLAGCTTAGQGSASIYVKDAPTDEFSEVHVVFTEVLVHAAGDDGAMDGEDGHMDDGMDNESMGEHMDDEEGDGDASWITVFENASGVDVDLLAASGDASAFLGEASLDAGNYTQIRVIVDSAYGIDLDGETVDITVSSSTLKIVRPFEVVAGEESQVIIDFDLDRSLKETGNGQWRLTPVVGHVDVHHVDDAGSGRQAHHEGEIAHGEGHMDGEDHMGDGQMGGQ